MRAVTGNDGRVPAAVSRRAWWLDDADQWRRAGRSSGYLYRGERLAALSQALPRWREDPGRYPPLPGAVEEFVTASLRAETRATRLRRTVAAALGVLLVATLAAATVAIRAQQDALTQSDVSISRRLADQPH